MALHKQTRRISFGTPAGKERNMEFEMGQIVDKETYTQAALACNKVGDRHIEEQNGQYVIVANPEPADLTVEEQVLELESQTGLTREIRELILMNNLETSDYVKERVSTIESMANALRKS